MLVQLYVLDGTMQCETNQPNPAEDGKAKLEQCEINVSKWSRMKRPGMMIAQCNTPTGWCWVYEVDAPTRHSLYHAGQAGFRVWSFDESGLAKLVQLWGGADPIPWQRMLKKMLGGSWPVEGATDINGGVDVYPWSMSSVAASDGGVEPWPWKRIEEILGVDVYPWRSAIQEGLEQAELPEQHVAIFDDSPTSASSIHLNDILDMKLRVFSPDNMIGDASYDTSRVNIAVNDAGRVERVWIG